MKQLNKEESKNFFESDIWKNWTPKQIVELQLFQDRVCVPWGLFTELIEKVLKRPVYTHEFGDAESLRKEFLGEKKAPTLEEIVNLIPEEKRIIIQL